MQKTAAGKTTIRLMKWSNVQKCTTIRYETQPYSKTIKSEDSKAVRRNGQSCCKEEIKVIFY